MFNIIFAIKGELDFEVFDSDTQMEGGNLEENYRLMIFCIVISITPYFEVRSLMMQSF